jgi:hypothetical protein
MLGQKKLATRLMGAVLYFLTCATTLATPPAVLQRGYSTGVINANTAETILTPSNVNETTFGRIFSLPVDGQIYAQPLYVPGVAIPNQGTHNVLYVATMNDSIFAFDADTPGAPLWSVNYASLLGAAPVPIVNYVATDSLNIAGACGIEGTPVIDPTTLTMYFVTNTLESANVVYRLHAVDITTGAEKFGGPVIISGTFTAGGKTVTFTPLLQNQRVSLTIAKNQVVIGFGSHEDYYGYYGWLMSYDKTSLAQTGVFNAAPTADHGAGIWQSGLPPAVDSSGYVYAFSGNGFAAAGQATAYDGINNFPDSALKLDPGNGLKLIDWFTPANYAYLDANDLDLSSGGPLLLPGTTSLLIGGKDGNAYLLNTQNMGKLQTNNAGALQAFQASPFGGIRTGFAYWARSTAAGGPIAFLWASYDALKAFPFNGTTLAIAPSGSYYLPSDLFPGGELTLSSNGDNAGIIWASVTSQGDADHRMAPGSIVAINAATMSPLWSSAGNASRDDFGLLAKYVPPLVVNGKVYVASNSHQVVVYGLLPTNAATVTAWPMNQAALGGSAAFVVNALSPAGTPQTATWSVTGLPTGANGSFITDSQGQTVLQITAGATTPSGNTIVQATASVNGTQTTQPVMVNFSQTAVAPAAAATADSYYPINPPSFAIDGNQYTYWETLFGATTPNYPHELTIDLGSVQPIYGISYLTRQDGCSNGMIMQYTISLSRDGINFPEVTGGSFDYGPQWHNFNCAGNSFFLPKRMTVTFPTTSARYVQLTGLGSVTDVDPWASAAEVQVFTAATTAATAGTATPIVPYIGINGVWLQEATATVAAGTAVSFGPQPSPGGTWSWKGPNGFTSTSRELDNVALNTGVNVYVATYTNAAGATSTATFTITVTPAASFTLSPTATSVTLVQGSSGNDGIAVTAANGFNGAVNFAATGLPAGVTASFSPTSSTSGSTLSLTASGAVTTGAATVTVTGTSGTLSASTVIPLNVTAAPKSQTISFAAIPAQNSGTTLALSATASSGLAVTYVSSTPTLCTVSGSTASFIGVGTCIITAAQSGNATYAAATSVAQSVTVAAAVAATPTPIVPFIEINGVWLQEATATVAAGSAVSFGPQPSPGGTWSWKGPNGFTSTSRELDNLVLATGANVYVATYTNPSGMTSTATFTITVTPAPSFTLSSTATSVSLVQGSSGIDSVVVTGANGFTGTVNFAVSGLPAGVTASFSPTSSTSSSTLALTAGAAATTGAATLIVTGTSGTLSASTPILVNVTAAPKSQTISFAAIPAQNSGTTLALTATASSGLAVTYVSSTPTLCTVSGSTASFIGVGTCIITAAQSGNASYAAATSVTQSVTVAAAVAATPTTIVPFVEINGVWLQEATATVAAGTAVSFGPQPSPGGTWSWKGPNGFTSTSRELDNLVLATGANVYVATYTNPSGMTSTATFTITVTPAALKAQTISFAAIPAQNSGATLALTATASSGLAVTYVSSTPTLCTVSGSTASFIAVGTCIITAAQAGNATYAAATLVTQSVTVRAAASFTLSSAATTLTLVQGTSGNAGITVTAANGFTGAVSFAVTGLPAGVTAIFSPSSSTSSSTLTVTASAAATTGTARLTLSGTSGANKASTTITLNVVAATANVSLGAQDNLDAIAITGTSVTGIDGDGWAYASALLPATITYAGASFTLGAADTLNAVTSATIPLPAGNFTTLSFLGTGVYGAQTNQTFVVTYTDGSSTSFTQSLSDWGAPKNYSGETSVISTAYRISPTGATQNGPWYVYGYSLKLNSAKTVKSLTLPANRNVVVLGVALTGGTVGSSATSVKLTAK